jgi:hypothetical protein
MAAAKAFYLDIHPDPYYLPLVFPARVGFFHLHGIA